MSLSLSIIELYLSINLLLVIGTFLIPSKMRSASRSLLAARIILFSCIAAPLVMSFTKAPNRPLISYVAIEDLATTQLATSMARPEHVSESPSSQVLPLQETIDPFLIASLLIGLGVIWHLSKLARDVLAAERIVRHAMLLRHFRNARVVVSGHCSVPFSVRLFHKTFIVLPTSILNDGHATRIAIAHEAQHHRQGDCVIAYATEMMRALFFWNPFAHRWQRILSDLQEFSCDEALVGRRRFAPHEYGRCLFEVAQAAIPPTSSFRELACAPGMAGQRRGKPQSLLLRRIEMLSKYPSAASRSPMLFPALIAALVAVPFGVAFAARGSIDGAKVEPIDQSAVDPRIQSIAESEVHAAMNRLKAQSVGVVVMDPASGRVLAFAEGRSDPSRESWSTRQLTPASTVKPFILAGAIETGAATEQSTYNCRKPYVVAGETFRNWSNNIDHAVSATTTIAQSVNVCAIHMALDTGSGPTRTILERFGLAASWDKNTNENLQLARTALGDTESVTIAQLAKAFATLANSGRIPGSSETAVSQTTAQAVGRTLLETVRIGTGRAAAIPGIKVAGKTGSSSAKDTGKLAMFGGYVPADRPQYAAFVVVEDGLTTSGNQASGGQAAAPLFRNVMRRSLIHLEEVK